MYSYRQLCLRKDLREAELWGATLEMINEEIGYLLLTEKKLVNSNEIGFKIQEIRRKIILCSATLCKYEQALKNEFEYGKSRYDEANISLHERHRNRYLSLIQYYQQLKTSLYKQFIQFKK